MRVANIIACALRTAGRAAGTDCDESIIIKVSPQTNLNQEWGGAKAARNHLTAGLPRFADFLLPSIYLMTIAIYLMTIAM